MTKFVDAPPVSTYGFKICSSCKYRFECPVDIGWTGSPYCVPSRWDRIKDDCNCSKKKVMKWIKAPAENGFGPHLIKLCSDQWKLDHESEIIKGAGWNAWGYNPTRRSPVPPEPRKKRKVGRYL
jgi:hypothetical protein